MGCLHSKEQGINDTSLFKVNSPTSVYSDQQQNNNVNHVNGRLGIAPRQLPNYNSSGKILSFGSSSSSSINNDNNNDEGKDTNPTPPSLSEYYPSKYRLVEQCAIGIQNIQASSMFISDDSVTTDSSPDIDLTPATNISDDSSITSCSPDAEKAEAAASKQSVNDNTEESGVVNWLEESNTTLFTSTSTCEKKSYGSPYHPLSKATESSNLPSSHCVVNDYIILSELGTSSLVRLVCR